MYIFDEFNALQILKSFQTFCVTHPTCHGCPLFVKGTKEKCVFQLCGNDRADWVSILEGRIRERLEENDEK